MEPGKWPFDDSSLYRTLLLGVHVRCPECIADTKHQDFDHKKPKTKDPKSTENTEDP